MCRIAPVSFSSFKYIPDDIKTQHNDSYTRRRNLDDYAYHMRLKSWDVTTVQPSYSLPRISQVNKQKVKASEVPTYAITATTETCCV